MRRREFIASIGGVAFGGAVGWPLAARAQQRTLPVVGFLSGIDANQPNVGAFRQGLADQGYLEGRNVEILYRFAEAQFDRLPTLGAELVSARVAVIFATGAGSLPVLAAKSATTTTPIVFTTGSDPVEEGLVANLNRPGGNITGASFFGRDLNAKRLELLHEIVPGVASIGYLVNPTAAPYGLRLRDASQASGTSGACSWRASHSPEGKHSR